MQKKLIALAVAGLASTAAFAQTNVVVYGIADGTLDYVWASGAKRNTFTETGNLNVRGTSTVTFTTQSANYDGNTRVSRQLFLHRLQGHGRPGQRPQGHLPV